MSCCAVSNSHCCFQLTLTHIWHTSCNALRVLCVHARLQLLRQRAGLLKTLKHPMPNPLPKPWRCRYLPIAGYKPFVDSAIKLALGDDSPVIADKRVAAIQSLSGTGACRVMAAFMHRYMPGAGRSHASGRGPASFSTIAMSVPLYNAKPELGRPFGAFALERSWNCIHRMDPDELLRVAVQARRY